MEKKLTDEEIAQALLQNIEYGKTLTYFDKLGNHKAITITDIIAFINRLQDEKKELKSIAEYQQDLNIERWLIIQDKNNTIAEQKAEIERLTEERKTANKHDLMYWFIAYKEASEQCDELVVENSDVNAKNVQLQKQVDELKAIREIQINELHEQHAIVAEEIERQAVKYTAEKFAERLKAKLNEWLEDNEDNDGKIDFGIAEIELIGVKSLDGEVIAESLIDEICKEFTGK